MEFRDDGTTTSALDQRPAASEQRVSLVIYTRTGVKVIPLGANHPVVVGRAQTTGIAVDDPSVSRRHARFTLLDQQVCVEDLGSSNGTFVNGVQIIECTPVQPGQEIRLGGVSVGITVLGETESRHRTLLHHDRFVGDLEDEIARARAFGRTVGLVNVRPEPRSGGQIGRWCPGVQTLLRPFHRVGMFGADEIEIAVPEIGRAELLALGQQVRQAGLDQGAHLLCGLGLFPECATSSEELLEVTRRAAKEASPGAPLQVAKGHAALEALDLTPLADDEQPVLQGRSMIQLFHTMRRLSSSNIPVLILGETGSGKEVVARALHRASPRHDRRMLCINCGAIPSELLDSALFGHERGAFTGAHARVRGVFEEADGGTVLLDEVGELSPAAQVALLRVLETKRVTRVGSHQEVPVDIRVLAATHCNLEEMCREGRFRWDLLFRLNTMVLRVPPLRERLDELEPLVSYFIRQANHSNRCAVTGVALEAAGLLRRYPWPGNVRELRNAIERAVVLTQSGPILAESLPERVRAVSPAAVSGHGVAASPTLMLPKLSAEEVATLSEATRPPPELEPGGLKERLLRRERALLLAGLTRARWNHVEAARVLEVPLRTLFHKVKQHRLKETPQEVPATLVEEARQRLAQGRPFHELLQQYEAELLREALQRGGGDHERAAELLQISLRTLQKHLRLHGLT